MFYVLNFHSKKNPRTEINSIRGSPFFILEIFCLTSYHENQDIKWEM